MSSTGTFRVCASSSFIPRALGLAVLIAGLTPGNSRAGVIYDETQSGDLSDDGSVPTVLAVAPGLNDVIGTTGRGTTGIDRDYFTFTVPAGMELASIVVLPGTTTGGD